VIPRRRRRGERGNATVVVAVAGVALTAATGLAIDGGMAAGAFRHAQNAADAGALAAARQVYLDATSVPPVASTTANLTPVAQREVVQHNGSQLVSVNGLGLVSSSSSNNSTWLPTSTGGVSGFSALADMTTVLPTTPETSVHLVANDAQANITMAPISSGGSQATAEAELANASASAAGQTPSGDVQCGIASAHYTGSDNTGAVSSCSGGTLPSEVYTAGTMVTTVNPDARVSAGNVPTSEPSVTVLDPNSIIKTLLGVTLEGVSASLVQGSNQLGWPGGVLTSTSSTSATNVQVTTPLVDVSASSIMMSLSISMPSGGHPTINATCTPTTLTFTPQPVVPGVNPVPVPISSTCQPQVTLPTIPGATIDMPWIQPGTDYNAACSYNNGSGVWSCPGVQACLLRITIAASDTTMCLGEANISYAATASNPNTASNNAIAQFAGAVQVVATLPQTTYFMRVVGIDQTSPTATAQAAPEGVVDESSSAFAASPFGMPADATVMSGSDGCVSGALQPKCDYYMYGPYMTTYNPAASMPASWQGQLTATSNHHVGGQPATGSTSLTATPQLYQGTSSYYLEPVFDPVTGIILYYGVFLPVDLQPHWGQYVTNIPVQADSAPGWTVLQQGAVSIKLEG